MKTSKVRLPRRANCGSNFQPTRIIHVSHKDILVLSIYNVPFFDRPQNTLLIEDIKYLLLVKFHQIQLSGFRKVENVSAKQRPGGHLVFPIGPKKKQKHGRRHRVLASFKVSSNSVERFQRRSRKCLSQSEARGTVLFFRSF